ncbi:MAG: DUF433 domain-containing protein, partial [Burkholderiales bacterium]
SRNRTKTSARAPQLCSHERLPVTPACASLGKENNFQSVRQRFESATTYQVSKPSAQRRGRFVNDCGERRIALMTEADLLKRVTVNPKIFGGKPIIRGRRLAVEHILGMLAAGDSVEDLIRAYPWLEREDVLACLAYARRVVGHERIEPAITDEAA